MQSLSDLVVVDCFIVQTTMYHPRLREFHLVNNFIKSKNRRIRKKHYNNPKYRIWVMEDSPEFQKLKKHWVNKTIINKSIYHYDYGTSNLH